MLYFRIHFEILSRLKTTKIQFETLNIFLPCFLPFFCFLSMSKENWWGHNCLTPYWFSSNAVETFLYINFFYKICLGKQFHFLTRKTPLSDFSILCIFGTRLTAAELLKLSQPHTADWETSTQETSYKAIKTNSWQWSSDTAFHFLFSLLSPEFSIKIFIPENSGLVCIFIRNF